MIRARVHLCLVSAQAAPNLLPALDPECKPEGVILLVSGKMARRADALEKVLRTSGIKTERVAVDDEHDFGRLEEIVSSLAAEHESGEVALNLSGGTKLMALAAYSTVRQLARNWEMFYVDIDTDEIILLSGTPRRSRLNARLRLPDYLRAYGYDPEDGPSRRTDLDERCRELIDNLIMNVGTLAEPLGQLNFLVQRAEGHRTLTVELAEHRCGVGLEALLREFADAAVLTVEGSIVEFRSEAHRTFAGGGWLEEYVFRTVCRLSRELDLRDKLANVAVVDAGGVRNELDVAFMARNRLHVIECKTARMNGQRAGKANDALFKLAEIARRVGGTGTRAMLASYRKLEEPERVLAHALNVELVCGADLRRLDEKLKRWVIGP